MFEQSFLKKIFKERQSKIYENMTYIKQFQDRYYMFIELLKKKKFKEIDVDQNDIVFNYTKDLIACKNIIRDTFRKENVNVIIYPRARKPMQIDKVIKENIICFMFVGIMDIGFLEFLEYNNMNVKDALLGVVIYANRGFDYLFMDDIVENPDLIKRYIPGNTRANLND